MIRSQAFQGGLSCPVTWYLDLRGCDSQTVPWPYRTHLLQMPHYHVWQHEQKVARRGSWLGPQQRPLRFSLANGRSSGAFPWQHTAAHKQVQHSLKWFLFVPYLQTNLHKSIHCLYCFPWWPTCFFLETIKIKADINFQFGMLFLNIFFISLLIFLAVIVWHETNTYRLQQGKIWHWHMKYKL